ncbi:acyltransferase 3 [Caballeronia cordobensis]|uniref:Acyltransferase 3 n=1 Tax=Caballeronia cordobensis TaxID=1353886 RepID=A0A158FMT8_CABCO|nr:acyltransferase [Caballeronia cordobensis]SAL20941.1 acyltransferase 3 [Caballeronia cordobensis]
MKGRIDALTSLRFFAAAAIFALHAVQIPGFPVTSFGSFNPVHGVSFFYVLSGFILHYNYRDKEIPWLRFMALRFARIWPLHLFGLGLALALRWSDIVSWIHAYVSPAWLFGIVFLLQAWAPDNNIYFAINGVSWSISVEMFFYACFVPLSLGFRKKPFMLLLGAIAFHAIYLFVTRNHEGPPNLINPAFRLLEFVIGIAAAELMTRARSRGIATKFSTFAEFAAICIVLWADSTTGAVIGFMQGKATDPVLATIYTMWPDPFIAALLVVFASGAGAMSKVLGWRPLIVLGEISFALYLVHQPVQWAVSQHLQSLGPVGMLIASIVVSLAVSAAAHYWIEKPIYNVAAGRLRKKRRESNGLATIRRSF